MPTLNWLGKDKIINHHQQVPYRVLEPQYTYGDADNGNMIIQGDNLDALKSLLPYYEGKVKCIYIDPPYNTGSEGWVYNDNVNDPKIKKWLGETVGKEGEDLSRHDKWLCMMYPRLRLLQQLLAEDGAIFISIDDNEQANLRLICNEIFGAGNFAANIIWQKRTSPDARLNLGAAHDFILVYAKELSLLKASLNKTQLSDDRSGDYKNPDNDPRGVWASVDLTGQTGHATPSQFYEIVSPSGKKYPPPKGRCWALAETTFNELFLDNRIWFGKKGNSRPRQKKFLSETEGANVWTWWPHSEVGHNQEAKKEIIAILREDIPFETPKPTRLIERILQIATNPGDIVLDSFAGSGTTAHAVLKMNKKDGGNRKFILVEMMDYATTITAERIKHVIDGYETKQTVRVFDHKITLRDLKDKSLLESANEAAERAMAEYENVSKPKIDDGRLIVEATVKEGQTVPGTGGGFSFYELGDRLLLEDGNLNEEVDPERIREYVWYTETRTNYKPQADDYLLGVRANMAYYFYYEKQRVTILDHDFLHRIKTKAGGYLIYADINALSADEMDAANIRFKKIPRDIAKL